MVVLGGFGDMLEDFVELCHQLGSRDEARLAGLKSEPRKAESMGLAQWVAAHNAKEVKEAKDLVASAGKCNMS